jgi:hypothetical protein
MGKAKKQLTNERRAKRLGTGEGIAPAARPGGGISPLTWAVAGAVLLAVVIVAAAIVVTRGGGSSAAAAGSQRSAVVQDRLTHSKIDFTSQGTWAPNYANLQGAMSALGLTASAEMASVNHYHVHIRLVIDGHDVPVPAQIGLDAQNQVYSAVHTHDESGVIHIESTDASFRATLYDAFDMWGVYLSPRCVGGYCGGLKMWVNGTPSTRFGDLVLRSHQAITILSGKAPAGFKPDAKYAFPAGE